MTLTTQWTTIILMVGSGFLMGTILDIYRVLKGRFRLKGWTVSLVDFIYWMVCAGLVFSLLFWSNWGDFRFYIFIAILGGLGAYLRWCSSRITRMTVVGVQGAEKLIGVLYKIVYQTIWVPMAYVGRGVLKVGRILVNILFSSFLFLVQPFRWIVKPIQRAVASQVNKRSLWMIYLKKWWTKKKREDD